LIYTVLFNPSLDVWYSVEELTPGTTRVDIPSRFFPAGKALNVAKAINVLGEEVTVIGLMPRLSIPQFSHFCDEQGILHEYFPIDGHVRINATITEKSPRQVTHLNTCSAALTPRIQDELTELFTRRYKKGDIWIFAGSVPSGFDADVYNTMITRAKRAGVFTILDTRNEPLKLGVRAQPDMIKPNLSELEHLCGEEIHGVRHIALKGKRLMDMGIGHVFITLGSDGMIAIHDNDCLLCSIPPVNVVDTVGCGDAVVAGLAVGRRRQFSFSEMSRMALACGVSNAMNAGPGNIIREQVWQTMEEITIENA